MPIGNCKTGLCRMQMRRYQVHVAALIPTPALDGIGSKQIDGKQQITVLETFPDPHESVSKNL